MRRDIGLEPLHRELLDRAVLDGALNSLVEGLLEIGLILAQAYGDASAEQATRQGWSHDGIVLEVRLLEGADDLGGSGENGIDTSGREVEVVLLRGLVLADLGRALQVLIGEVGLNGRGLDANGLALEERLEILDRLLGRRLLGREVERCPGAGPTASSLPSGKRLVYPRTERKS